MTDYETELDSELERLVNKEYDHPACDQDCQSNAKGIALLGRLRELREQDAALRAAQDTLEQITFFMESRYPRIWEVALASTGGDA